MRPQASPPANLKSSDPLSPQSNTNAQKTTFFTNKKKFILFFLGLIFFLLATSAITLRKSQTQQSQPFTSQLEATPTPRSSNISLQDEVPQGWKTYRNEEYGFEVKYHPESNPNEYEGTEKIGQFSYLVLIRFGTVPLKSPHGYSIDISKKSLEGYRTDLLGHTTDKIDSEEETMVNGNQWTKINYQIFITTDYAPITTAVVNHGGYYYAITASSLDIDQILSTFKFLENIELTCQDIPTNTPELSFSQAFCGGYGCNNKTNKADCESTDIVKVENNDFVSGKDGITDCIWVVSPTQGELGCTIRYY